MKSLQCCDAEVSAMRLSLRAVHLCLCMCMCCTPLTAPVHQGRRIPGTPVSALWWTLCPKGEFAHHDKNVRGVSFVLTSRTVEGGSIAVQEPGKPARQHHLKAGEVMYGQWAQGAHCNEKMPPSVVGGPLKGRRRSWTLYLDYRVLASNYAYMYNKGVEL
jgi:hypothetical protein